MKTDNYKHHTPQLKAIIRVCASCERVFINSKKKDHWGCPSCGFVSYGAVWLYRYNSLYTFYRLCLDTIRGKGVRRRISAWDISDGKDCVVGIVLQKIKERFVIVELIDKCYEKKKK